MYFNLLYRSFGLVVILKGLLPSVLGQELESSVDPGGVENTLKCFQCKSPSLDECRKLKYLQPCPSDQAYDRCQTIISKPNPDKNFTVTKQCALAPCFLDSSVQETRNSHCDINQRSFQCLSCCLDNACNTASASFEVAAWKWLLAGWTTSLSSMALTIIVL
eukprot:maker-scaffold60_size442463-snap-gene-3.22 protein:Tk12077 transcript:maker-scaffold60_size442463-snap-gene-3.22-mRNA-1 annotation:"hypothetical protein IscW_ISCW012437"